MTRNKEDHHQRIAALRLGDIYPLYLQKVVRKGRTEEELICVIEWLTGCNPQELQNYISQNLSFEAFFENVSLNPRASQIKGLICGYRVEEIENPLTQKIRYLDKLVDELAKGKNMNKILRNN
jgi:hypothetical protein